MKTRQRIWLGLALAALATPVPAAVTYLGTDGIRDNILNTNTDRDGAGTADTAGTTCISCHSTTRTDSDGTATGTTADNRYSASTGVNFNTWAATQEEPYGAGNGFTYALGNSRIQGETMPYAVPPGATDYPSNLVPLSTSDKALFQQWVDDGALEYTRPSATTASATSVGKYGATLNADVNDNGDDATYYFQYGTVASGAYGTTSSSTTTAGWTGGGTGTQAITRTASGLACGTQYQVRAYGTNNAGTTLVANRNTVNFTTSACPNITTTAGTSVNEGASYYYNANGTGGITGFSLVGAPAWLDIDGITGEVTGTAPNLASNTTYNFTVRATDGTTNDDEAVSLTVVADQDAPTFSTGIGPTSAVEGSPYNTTGFDVNASDPEGTSVTYALNAAAITAGLSINSSSGLITGTPLNGYTSISVTVTVTDGASQQATQSWTITVTATNTPPSITAGFSPPTTGTEDTLYQYTVPVTDDDDPNDGSNLVFTLSGEPTGMTISDTGVISWTPSEEQVNDSGTTDFGPITVTVEDGNEDGTTPTVGNNGVKSFSVTVSPVNDAPSIAVIGAQEVIEEDTLEVTAVVTDPDEDDENDGGGSLTWTISAENAPGTVNVSNTGVITYTPGQNTDGTYSVTVRVADGGENSVAAATRTFSLTVVRLDGDGDTVADYNDNCLTTPNADQADNDEDGTGGGAGGLDGGDACDSDDDNDGISDAAEVANALDPFDDGDADGDLDGDGLTNLEEFTACAVEDTTCLLIGQDNVGPVINLSGDIEVVATGYYTDVELTATAADIVFGLPVPVDTWVDNEGPFRPGTHVLTWTAYDEDFNPTEETQTLRVVPTVTVGGTRRVGEGQTASLRVLLNGESPEYPVEIDYEIGGDVVGADLGVALTGTVTIASGTEAWINLPVLADALNEGDETLTLTLTGVTAGKAALTDDDATSLVVLEGPEPPVVGALEVLQDGEVRRVLFGDAGTVTVSALASDPNGDALTYTWSFSDAALGGTPSGSHFTFNPAPVDAGNYDVVVRVFDGTHTVEQRVTVRLVDNEPVLDGSDSDGDGISDDTEGLADTDGDGLLDFLDAVDSPEQSALRTDDTDALLVAIAEPGVALVAGGVAVGEQGGGIQVPADAVVDGDGDAVEDGGWDHVGAIYDFELHNVPASGSASVVLPLPTALPPSAQWRKFINGQWFAFVEGAGDAIASAASVDGVCPSFTSDDWQDGLVAGSDCVRLTLSDGGPNDSDGVVNGIIRDPSGPAVPESAEPAPPSSETGGGATGYLWLLLALTGFFRARRKDR